MTEYYDILLQCGYIVTYSENDFDDKFLLTLHCQVANAD
jgi:hypothetical protein